MPERSEDPYYRYARRVKANVTCTANETILNNVSQILKDINFPQCEIISFEKLFVKFLKKNLHTNIKSIRNRSLSITGNFSASDIDKIIDKFILSYTCPYCKIPERLVKCRACGK